MKARYSNSSAQSIQSGAALFTKRSKPYPLVSTLSLILAASCCLGGLIMFLHYGHTQDSSKIKSQITLVQRNLSTYIPVSTHIPTDVPGPAIPTNIFKPLKVIDTTVKTGTETCHDMLNRHPFKRMTSLQKETFQLEDYLKYLSQQPECQDIPIFTSMANVFSDLYWQLIENFIYTQVKFNLTSCSIMICVTDEKCMKLCEQSNFPCYNFRYDYFHPRAALPSALEQIGELKLLHIPKALQRGVNILMLDLDVGFLENPMKLVEHFRQYPKVDVFVQRDISFVMNRTREGWRTWYTVPLPNIGLFLCKGNEKTVKMFGIAWSDYQSITKPIKHNPGKDQNKVVNAMAAAGGFGLKWRYIPAQAAVLLDKIYKFEEKTYELGGEAALTVLNRKGSLAVHTTCYEQKTKVMGLKAANAFWNPYYYNPLRRTLTKPLVFQSEEQLRHEIRSLIYLAIATNRSLIIPNVLGNPHMADVDLYNGLAYWPGFRIAFFMTNEFDSLLHILEPSYYWRITRDYADSEHNYGIVPEPTIVTYNQKELKNMKILENKLISSKYNNELRLVLNIQPNNDQIERYNYLFNHNMSILKIKTEEEVKEWSKDSVGIWKSYDIESNRYGMMPRLNYNGAGTPKHGQIAYNLVQHVRLCENLFDGDRGNRSCFDKCD